MGILKTYIEMCKESKEIQKLWKKEDNYVWRPDVDRVILLSSSNIFWWEEIMKNYIWLPTQNQLQNMIIDEYNHNNIWMLINFTEYVDQKLYETSYSMEQLWLSFVVWELYFKKWDGKEWVKYLQ